MTDDVLCRSVDFELRADTNTDGLTLDGYGAVFDSPTRIDSWEGLFDESIARGAFKKSLSERTPVLQFDHGRHPMVGSIPLGSFESLSEDRQGLHVLARLHDNWLVQPVRDAIKSGSIPGMSFRFRVMKDEWRTAAGVVIKTPEAVRDALFAADANRPETIPHRTIREVQLFEVGPVVFPAYPETTVGVRDAAFAAALTDPQVRAQISAALDGTPAAPSEPEGGSGEGRAATPGEEPREHSRQVPTPEARKRDLILKGIIRNG